MKQKYIVLIFALVVVVGVAFYMSTFQKTETPPLVGGDRDAHGCIASAGYSWCESKEKCLRSWEEACDPSSGMTTVSTASEVLPE